MTDKEIIERLYDLWMDTEDSELSHLFHAAAERLEELAAIMQESMAKGEPKC